MPFFNSLADSAADKGHRIADVHVQTQILNYLAQKQRCLLEVMTAIATSKRIARVVAAATMRLEELTTAAACKKSTRYIDTPCVRRVEST